MKALYIAPFDPAMGANIRFSVVRLCSQKGLIILVDISKISEHIVDVTGERLSDYAVKPFAKYIPSRKGIKKAIKRGRIEVNGEKSTTGYIVKTGDRLVLYPEKHRVPRRLYRLEFDIPYEDDFLAVINKPAGIDVSGNKFRTVYNALGRLKKSKQQDALEWPKPVHRLDNRTRGLLLTAKTYSAMVDLGNQFENRTIDKEYHAVVHGETSENGGWDFPVDGKDAKTLFTRIKFGSSPYYGEWSLLRLFPKTGRTHQIRKHCAKAGFPIVGDELYGKKGGVITGKGLFLAATRLVFDHPDGDRREVEIEVPEKLRL